MSRGEGWAKTRKMAWVLALQWCCGAAVLAVNAQDAPVGPKVLALWSSKRSEALFRAPVLANVEFVLNTLGVYSEFLDIDTEDLPDPKNPDFNARYLGVLTAFTDELLPSSKKLVAWLERASQSDVPWVALGRLGFLENTPPAESRALLEAFGIVRENEEFNPLVIRVASVDRAWMGYERRVPEVVQEFPHLRVKRAAGEDVKVALELRVQGHKDRSTPVFVSKKVSMAYGEFGLAIDSTGGQRQWMVDPFVFLRAALRIDPERPVPEVSVMNGERVFISHVDGDGFRSLSQTDGKLNPDLYASEVMRDTLFKRFATIPFGVSYIVADIDPKARGNERLLSVAQSISQLPNVETASHTWNHPLDWIKGTMSYRSPNGLDPVRETRGSLQSLTQLLQLGHPIDTLYWSGDCQPDERSVAMLESSRFLNINGGDSRMDGEYPSIAFLSPLGKPVGKAFQVYAGAANDNVYTSGWQEPFLHGFRRVRESFERTAKPVPLKIIDVYFHFFSAERAPGLDALREILLWSEAQSLARVMPTTYIRTVLAHRRAKIVELEKNLYEITGADGLRTLRIDAPGARVPSLERSKGILGWRSLAGRLYIALDPAHSGAFQLSLADNRQSVTNRPSVERLGGGVRGAVWSGNKLRLTLESFARGPLVLGFGSGAPRRVRAQWIGSSDPLALAKKGTTWEISFAPILENQEMEVVID